MDTNMREWVESGLHQSVLEVVFTKKNGDERTMLCTTNLDWVPVENHPKTDGTHKEYTKEVKRVYDLDNNGWRSFTWDSVKSVRYSTFVTTVIEGGINH